MPEYEATPVIIEDARIPGRLRNFAGREGQYNREGDRSFGVLLDSDVAEAMLKDGWNVKWLRAREEGDPDQAFINVAVKYGKGRPPKIILVTSRGRTPIGEEEVELLDWADIRTADLIIRPYTWDVNGKSGVKAYLKSLFVTVEEDELDKKYAGIDTAPGSRDDPPF